ncbi:MAG: hypothetical protein Q8L47_03795 [bacterium]|nr:hypothetical protein [bacterium]
MPDNEGEMPAFEQFVCEQIDKICPCSNCVSLELPVLDLLQKVGIDCPSEMHIRMAIDYLGKVLFGFAWQSRGKISRNREEYREFSEAMLQQGIILTESPVVLTSVAAPTRLGDKRPSARDLHLVRSL